MIEPFEVEVDHADKKAFGAFRYTGQPDLRILQGTLIDLLPFEIHVHLGGVFVAIGASAEDQQ
jgi:hypothetical protein